MPMPWPETFTYTFATLEKLSGVPYKVLHKQLSREKLNPRNLEDVLLWLSKHGTREFRSKLAITMMFADSDRYAPRQLNKKKVRVEKEEA